MNKEIGIRSKNGDIFAYDPYTGCWVRVLQRAGGPYNEQITVRLSPVGGLYANGWDDVTSILINKQDVRYSPIHPATHYSHVLPESVYSRMIEKLDQETFTYLINADILPAIDWELYAKNSNGGVYLKECSKRHDGLFKICKIYENKFRNKEVGPGEFTIINKIQLSPGEVLLSGVSELDSDMKMNVWVIYNHATATARLHYSHEEGSSKSVISLERNTNFDWYSAFDSSIKGSRATAMDTAGDAIIVQVLEQSRHVMDSITLSYKKPD